MSVEMDRRRFVLLMGGATSSALFPAVSWSQTDPFVEPIRAFTGGIALKSGRVALEMPPLADNGNSVPLRVRVDSPMTEADHVKRITLLSEKNPRPVIATFTLGPWSGRAQVDTRVRLNGAQRIMAVVQLSDNTYWSAHADVIVTSTACWDES